MARWKFRSCPRCDGDIFIDRDLYGWFEHCIQCGYISDLKNTVKVEQQQTWSGKGRKKGHDSK